MGLEFTDHRAAPEAWARALGISREAVDLYLSGDVIDLHLDSFIWTRLFGYALKKRHGTGWFGGRFYSQVDLPRIREAAIGGGIWSITTNPFRRAPGRARTFQRNLARLGTLLAEHPEDVALVKNAAEYEAVRRAGKHGAFLGIQGGNALDASVETVDRLADARLVKVTLVHLTTSRIGTTSSPFGAGRDAGLTDFGRAFVARLNAKRIFVDLAHINYRGFFDAVAAHDRTQPLMVSHTGVTGVHPHWRNIDDAQIRAVAATGGVVGVMYHAGFLGSSTWNGRLSAVVDHLEHLVKVGGEEIPALGSDWDGLIVPPRELPDCPALPRLVQAMLDRGWNAQRVQKVLGGNFLRALENLRG